MKWLWLILTALWLTFFTLGVGKIPPPSRLLDLKSGLWGHRPQVLNDQTLPGLQQPVQVAWDKYGVPHFFAQNEADLYRAQGFVMASQRLFQMDLSSRQTSGRLSAWVGDMALPSDRFFVAFGMRDAADKLLNEYMADPKIRLELESFSFGINLYIKGMKQLPPEYVLLGVEPEPFSPRNVMYMKSAMTFSLAGRSMGTLLTPLQQKLGVAKVLDLFPEFLPAEYEDYVVPDRGGPRRQIETPELFPFTSHLKNIPSFPLANPGNGSNNWAVGPKMSSTGHSILANDTHLNYSIPNVWYENQLSVPQFNVYGVTLATVPGIINGTNGKIAWGPTNGTTSVLDWFEIEFENETSLRYKYKNQNTDQWLQARVIHEYVEVRGEEDRIVDVVWTRLGTLMHREGRYGLVANWMGHRARKEFTAVRELYEAKDAGQCVQSFMTNWAVPIQNFICADPDHISLLHAGVVPKREIGEGRFIMDGTNSRDTLAEAVSDHDHPMVIDPVSVLSANEKIEGPSYPNYLGWDFEPPFRGRMIRRRLGEQAKFSPDDMMRIQNDSHDLSAEIILPLLLQSVDVQKLSVTQQEWLKRLTAWDFSMLATRVEPSLFKAWYSKLKSHIVDHVFERPDPQNRIRDLRIAWMLKRLQMNPADSDQQWVGKPLPELVTESFQQAWQDLELRFGAPVEAWTWNKYNSASLRHVARLPGWGTDVLKMDGSNYSIRGNHGDHGPTFKAVYALGDDPHFWMQVPGGNEGDPFSPNYERQVEDWSRGEMREVEFYKDLDDARKRDARVVEFKP